MLVHRRRQLDIWQFQLVVAAVTGLMGAMDMGSSCNVFIPAGTFLILQGTAGLAAFHRRSTLARRTRLAIAGVVVTFALLAYDPRTVLTPRAAHAAHAALVSELKALDGPVCAPSLARIPGDFRLEPPLCWVPLLDMVRWAEARDYAKLKPLLEPLRPSKGSAYFLTNGPWGRGVCMARFLMSTHLCMIMVTASRAWICCRTVIISAFHDTCTNTLAALQQREMTRTRSATGLHLPTYCICHVARSSTQAKIALALSDTGYVDPGNWCALCADPSQP